MRVRASVDLAGLTPSDVDVQVVVGHVGDTTELHHVVTCSMRPTADGDHATEPTLPMAGAVGYTVRVLPRHALLAGSAELGRVVLAT